MGVMVPLVRRYTSLSNTRISLLTPASPLVPPARGVGMLVVRVLRGALKLRYLLLGGTLAGGSAIAKVMKMLINI